MICALAHFPNSLSHLTKCIALNGKLGTVHFVWIVFSKPSAFNRVSTQPTNNKRNAKITILQSEKRGAKRNW